MNDERVFISECRSDNAYFTINKILSFLLLILFLFPWLSFGLIETETQPYFIILGFLFLLLNFHARIRVEIWFLFLISLSSIFVAGAFGQYDFLTLRGILTYSSPFIVATSYYICRNIYVKEMIPILVSVNIIWLIAGLFQLIYGPDLFSFLLVTRSTPGRGVTSLAPEPTYFAMYLIFISWLIIKEYNYSFDNKKIILLLMINVFSILFVAKSTMATILICLAVSVYCFCKVCSNLKSLISIPVAALFFVVSFWSVTNFMPNSRVSSLLLMAIDNPVELFRVDESANQRLKHIIYPYYGVYDNALFPGGYHSFEKHTYLLDKKNNGAFDNGYESNIIMSGFGAIVYELGCFSMFYFMFIIGSVLRNNFWHIVLFELFFVTVFMSLAISISFPLVYMLLIKNFLSSR